ncbi:MAG: hypothetical protein CMD13_04350 [Flavobacteriales bacterium]|nr:hypothetical protein [Flavobacteriales bacterium]
MNITKIILISLLIFSSCQSNLNKRSTDINSEKITWSNSDEFPSVKSCNELIQTELIKECFKNFLSNEILKNLNLSKVLIDKPVNDTVNITLLVDNKGTISIINKIIPEKIIDAIPNFNFLLTNAIDSLPIVLPGTKTSLGISVNSKFQLPIILKSQ